MNIRQEILNAIKSILDYLNPANRPEGTVLKVDAAAGKINITDQLINSQLLLIAGIDNTGAVVFGDNLLAEITSFDNVEEEELVAFMACIKSGAGLFSAAQLQIFIIKSNNISITLKGGSTIAKMQFWRLAPTILFE